jgi:O-antigen ligase
VIVPVTGPPSSGQVWLVALVLGVAMGVAAALSVPFTLGVLTIVVAVYLFGRSGLLSEVVVGLYWIAFTVYETVFFDVTVPGFFYPFYALFATSVAVSLVRHGVRVPAPIAWTYGGFLFVVLVSFLGFMEPTGFEVVQRVFAYTFGLLVLMQFRSPRGLRVAAGAAILAGLSVGVWVIVSAIQGGFAYRGGIAANENVAAFLVGLGLVSALGYAVDRAGTRRPWELLGLLLLSSVMVYAVLLLASRGVAIGLAVSAGLIIVHAVSRDRRKLVVLVALALIVTVGVLLPGGGSLAERLEGEEVETGGRRTPIWTTTLESFADGGVRGVLIGHGFDSSKVVVQQRFGGITSVHNAYLQVLYEFGVVGLVLFLALHGYAVVRVWSVRGPFGLVGTGLLWLLLGVNLTADAPNGFMYWTALGLALAIATHRAELTRGTEGSGQATT